MLEDYHLCFFGNLCTIYIRRWMPGYQPTRSDLFSTFDQNITEYNKIILRPIPCVTPRRQQPLGKAFSAKDRNPTRYILVFTSRVLLDMNYSAPIQ